MPNGRPTLGQRIADWFEWLYDAIGLKDLIDNINEQRQSWAAIRSASDLRAHVARYGVPNPTVLAAKAKEVGLSENETQQLARPEIADALKDPSSFIGEMMQDASASPMLRELNEIFGALVLDRYIAALTGGRIDPHAPEIERVRALLGAGAPFAVLGTILSTVGALASVGTVQDLGGLFTKASDLVGTPYTAARVLAPIVDRVVLDPLERLAYRTFRPGFLARAQWTDLYALGKIDVNRLYRELANLGFTDEQIGWIVDLAEQQLNRSDIVALWNKGRIGQVECAHRLRKLGYSNLAVEEIMFLARKEETSEDKGAYLGTLRKALKEQLISESVFREALEKQGRSREAIDLEIAVIKLDWEVAAKTAAKSDIKAAYMQDVIGRPEAEHWLTESGFVLHDVKVIVDTWDRQKAPTYKTINKSEILAAWGTSVLTQPEAYQRLRDVGYSERDATILIDTYAKTHLATRPPAGRALTDSDIMWAWHTEVLDEKETLARLVERGYTSEDAQLIFETFRRLHPRITVKAPKELAKNDILEAWGRNVIDEDTTFAKLLTIGYLEQDAGILMDTYEARAEALPPEPTIAQLISATRRGVIDQAVLSQKLTVMGLPAESVQFYVAYALAPLPEKGKALSKSEILKLWTEGRHSRAWALERLLAMNYTPEDAEDILWLSRPEISDTETYVLWSHGIVPDEIAIAMWTSMGFTEEQIAEVMG